MPPEDIKNPPAECPPCDPKDPDCPPCDPKDPDCEPPLCPPEDGSLDRHITAHDGATGQSHTG